MTSLHPIILILLLAGVFVTGWIARGMQEEAKRTRCKRTMNKEYY